MSSLHFQSDHAKRDSHQHHKSINKTTNPALKINKDSHFIKKSRPLSLSSSSSSLSSSSSSVMNAVAAAIVSTTTTTTTADDRTQQPRHPVIIYTHSPKVIHTHPKDFMALVQKLTGFSSLATTEEGGRASSSPTPPPPPPQLKTEPCDDYINAEIKNDNSNTPHDSIYDEDNNNSNEITAKNGLIINEDNDSTSVVTDEKDFDPQNNSNNSFDNNDYNNNNDNNNSMPYFHQTSMDFLYSGQPFSNYVDSYFLMRSSLSSSSSSLESMKDLPSF